MTHLERLILIVILCSYIALTFALSEVISFNKGTDEGYNLAYTKFILTHGRLPVTYDERNEIGAKANWPPLYHLIVAALNSSVDVTKPPTIKLFWDSFRYRALDLATENAWYILSEDQLRPYYGVFWVLHVGRWLSIFFGVMTLGFIGLTLWELKPQWQALFGLGFLAFLPAFAFITASMNEDGLVAMLIALYFWRLVRLIKEPTRWSDYVFIGLLLGLTITVKYTAIILPLEVMLIILFLARPYGKLWAIQRLMLTGLSTLLGASWWFAWNLWYLNRVAELGFLAGILAPFSSGANISIARLGNYLSGGKVGMATIPEEVVMSSWPEWVTTTFLSFWGVTINHVIPYFYLAYGVIMLVLVVIIWGVRQVWRNEPQYRGWLGLALGHVGLCLILPIVNFALSRRLGATAQGRHIFIPAATALVIIAVWGLTAAIPKRWHGITFSLLTVGLLFWSMAHWQLLDQTNAAMLPFRTMLESATSLAHPIQLNFDDKIELSSYDFQIEPSAIKLQLAWRPLITMTESYQFKVTVFDKDEHPVSLWQGYPGQGRVPTLAWESDMVVFDRLTLPVLPLSQENSGFGADGLHRLQIEVLGHDGPLKIKGENITTKTLTMVDLPLAQGKHHTHQLFWKGSEFDPLTFVIGGSNSETAFRYPGTILVSIASPYRSPDIQVELVDEANQAWPPTSQIDGMYNFVIGPRWVSGKYRLQFTRRDQQMTTDPILTVENWWPRYFAPPEPIAVPLAANFANQLNLLGYQLPRAQVKAGEAFPITLYWQAMPNKSPQADFIQFNNLLDSSGKLLGGYQRLPLEYYSTLLWSPGEVVVDGYTVPVAADAPPGQYYLDVGYYIIVGESAVNLPLVIDGAKSDISHVTIGPIEVVGQ